LIKRDAMKTLRRWGYEDLDVVLKQRERRIAERAAQALDEHDARLYLFGHTHAEALQSLGGGRYLCNTGTWMKRMQRVKSRFHLPPVYVPGFRLTYALLRCEGTLLRVEIRARRKTAPTGLSWLERFSLLGVRLPRQPEEADALLEAAEIRPRPDDSRA
jgi:hypothetical protein